MKKDLFLKTLEWAVRINVFIKLFIYGTGKILGQQFYRKGEIPEGIGAISLADTGSYNLAWTFFGHSEGYIWFIGISQLIGATLFLIPKTKLIGGAMLIPILLNIIVVDYFFGVAYGALFSACFYLISILWVFYLNKERIGDVIRKMVIVSEKTKRKKKVFIQLSLIVGFFIGLFFLEYFFIDLFGYTDR